MGIFYFIFCLGCKVSWFIPDSFTSSSKVADEISPSMERKGKRCFAHYLSVLCCCLKCRSIAPSKEEARVDLI